MIDATHVLKYVDDVFGRDRLAPLLGRPGSIDQICSLLEDLEVSADNREKSTESVYFSKTLLDDVTNVLVDG